MNRLLFSTILILGSTILKAQPKTLTQEATAKQRLEQEITRLSLFSGGKLGVCAIHIESGKKIVSHGHHRVDDRIARCIVRTRAV